MYAIAVLVLYVAIIHWKMNASLEKTIDTDTTILIILGATATGRRLSPVLKSRLDKGFELWQANPSLKVVVSGGNALDMPRTEAQLMHDYLIERGMDPQSIFMEEKSSNTYENLRNCRGMGSRGYAVVSSEFHAVRAAFLAKRLGLKAQIIGAKTPKGRRLKQEVREHLAIIKSWLWDKEH